VPLAWQLVIDCADPNRQARFWAQALGYTLENNTLLIDGLRVPSRRTTSPRSTGTRPGSSWPPFTIRTTRSTPPPGSGADDGSCSSGCPRAIN